ncbi:WD repeat-containing protein 38 [Entomortierella lignicola]|nr:WD repeat-containing protein 38 [Entomortierella lignicola]
MKSTVMVANFENCPAGHYSIHWRIKKQPGAEIPNGLHFTANVSYDAELDINGTLNVFMTEKTLKGLDSDELYDLELEETLTVQPHTYHAHVQVILCNMKDEQRKKNSGLIIEHVEIRPLHLQAHSEEGVKILKVVKATSTNFTESMGDQRGEHDAPENTPISRLVASKSNNFLASLALTFNTVYITVWDMDSDSSGPQRAVISIHPDIPDIPDISNIPIGLAISANGDQIAVYQEPKIGEWVEKSPIREANLKFMVYNNPLVKHPVEISGGKIINMISPETGAVSVLTPIESQPDQLKDFIGYGGFIIDARASGSVNAGANGINTDEDPERSNAATDKYLVTSIFVACNGLYLDIFETSAKDPWTYMHSIGLADLNPTISRRITCKMMMETISSKTFMWLEDSGVCCTVWDIMKGTNISYISAGDDNLMGRDIRYSKMAISPSESIVALATTNGTLTTYFTKSGVPIDDRIFPGFKIEHVGFHGHDNQLFVVLRDSETLDLCARILDSLELKSEIAVNQVPIPTIGSTILAFFDTEGYKDKGVICEAFGSKINRYVSYQPTSSDIDENNPNVVKADTSKNVAESLIDGYYQYRVVVEYHREHLPEGLHARYWVHHVKVIKEHTLRNSEEVIFWFIPEPWMRKLTTKEIDPLTLMSAYFLPDHNRFAVVGRQTIQIWKLPKHPGSQCTLQFIWSKPKEVDVRSLNFSKRKQASEYYWDIVAATIRMDRKLGNTAADIKASGAGGSDINIPIPGSEYTDRAARAAGTIGSRYAIDHCFSSIYLLADTYAFCRSESSKNTKLRLPLRFSYDDHANAIIQFTSPHLNRQKFYRVPIASPNDDKKPKKGWTQHKGAAIELKAQHKGEVIELKSQYKQDFNYEYRWVTLLTLLLEHRKELHKANHVFVKGLLEADGGFWVPNDNVDLNPLKIAIEIKNRPLIEAFIFYGVRYAKERHPAYLLPAVQCLKELAKQYSDIVVYLYRRSSYVPAHNHGYLFSHMMIADSWYKALYKSLTTFFSGNGRYMKSRNLDDYEKPVFSLRSQLPMLGNFNIRDTQTFMIKKRIMQFPDDIDEETRSMSKFTHRVYVCPYPKFSKYGPNKQWCKGLRSGHSPFTEIAGKDFFDNPAMEATLRFKWNKYASFYWFIRFFFVLLFTVIMITITTAQVTVSTLPDISQSGNATTTDFSTEARYLLGIRGIFWVAIANGALLLSYEIMQFLDNWKKYILSPYNFLDFVTYMTNVIGCAIFLRTQPTGAPDDRGPSQNVALSFAILALYLNLLFELRVVKPLGIVVNIILNIARKIRWFFTVLVLFMMSFTLALMHLLHTRRYEASCISGDPSCTREDYPDDYPRNFFEALTDTYFFLAGRYDPISKSLDNGSTSFRFMMLAFFLFTAILLLNILIALMNDAFDLSKSQGEAAWRTQISTVISEVERILMPKKFHLRSDYFPDYIYYYAPEKTAEEYESSHKITNQSQLSPENKFLMDTFIETMGRLSTRQQLTLEEIEYISNVIYEQVDETTRDDLQDDLQDDPRDDLQDDLQDDPRDYPRDYSRGESLDTYSETNEGLMSQSPPSESNYSDGAIHNVTPASGLSRNHWASTRAKIQSISRLNSAIHQRHRPREQLTTPTTPTTPVNQGASPLPATIGQRPVSRRQYTMESVPPTVITQKNPNQKRGL